MESKVFFLLSSTNDPYIRDILDVLFLPSGIEYRFRYNKQWVPDDLQKEENLKSLVDAYGFVVHIDTETHSEELRHDTPDIYDIREFIPIRKVQIRDARFLGEFLWISFTLGDWVHYKEDGRAGVLNEHHEASKKVSPSKSRDKGMKLFYEVEQFEVGTIPDNFSGNSAVTNSNWFKIVSHVSKLEAHQTKQSVFLKLWRIAQGGKTECVEPAKLPGGFTGYVLESGQHYFIDVMQFFPYKALETPFRFIVQTDSRVVGELKPDNIVQGKYDLLRMIVQCEQIGRDENSFMRFLAPDQRQYMIASNLVHIRVKRSLRRWFQRIGVVSTLTGVGVLLAGISSQLASGQPVNTTVLVLSALGAVLVALGTIGGAFSGG